MLNIDNIKRGPQLYQGKAKTIYGTNHDDLYIMQFRDDATAFNGLKHAQLNNKGRVNNYFNSYIMRFLESSGIATHFKQQLDDHTALVHSLQMIPVECVVRNYAAGGLCKRLGIKRGVALTPPVFEFFYKNDKLDDPMINEQHMLTFGWASAAEITELKQLTQRINELLLPLFLKAGFILADFKLEFGRFNGALVLGDEFTPDGCRIWDQHTQESLDKDRFRQDLGQVIESYEFVAEKIGVQLPKSRRS